MKVSLNWLKDYIDLRDINVEQIVDKLTYAGLEVDEVIDQAKIYDNIVVGYVKERRKHPNADKLSLCIVNDGSRDYSVVCGAPNVAEGQKVPFAKIGAVIPSNGLKIEKVKLRGEVSEGMICSEKELEISDNHEGIMVLDSSLEPGTPFSKVMNLDDVVLDIAITPNRADALSHIGIARDLAALFDRKLNMPEIKLDETDGQSSEYASVEIIDAENCPRYVAKVVLNVEIKESPEWLKRRIESIGLRPINNVVDVTNFVLYEVGQPLHAFDLDKLAGKKIVVKKAREGEKFVTLDSKERILSETDLMICDAERSVAIAGVMGGENSEVTPETKNILIESAFFNPSSVRKTAKRLGLQTDASYRFERGADYNITVWAAKRAAQLIAMTTGGNVCKSEIDAYPKPFPTKNVELRYARIKRILGYDVDKETVKKIFVNLGFGVNESDESVNLEVPSYRHDIEREIDLIEEVARIYGYDKIPEVEKISVTLEEKVDQSENNDRIRNILNALGFYEILTNSLLREELAKEYGNPLGVLNPQSAEMSHLRPSLIPGMLQAISNNIKVNEKNLQLFEIGKVFERINDEINSFDDFKESEHLIIGLTGNAIEDEWYEKERKFDFFDLKGFAAAFLNKYLPGVEYEIKRIDSDKFEYGMEMLIDEAVIVRAGKLNDELLKPFEIEQDVFVAVFDLDNIKSVERGAPEFKELLKFPKVYRDFAFILDREIEAGEVIKVIRNASSNLLHHIKLFDIFQSESLGMNKKSLAFRLEYYDKSRTLKEEEVDKEFRRAIKAVEEKFNAKLRGS
ncbi:phenylalanine--tRNA ligase subunit beta [Melioribacter sp. Ez-97]|uniref:phenylalanine--tRNA ligase subunit beta n=1 Tax=Melioribacter sp. Ez-97 TaxID=3423434 RepID=UPI003EDAC67C